MITPNFTNRGLAKIKFFVGYVVSVLLIFLVLSSFFESDKAAETGNKTSGSNSQWAAIDEALHQRLQSLQSATVFYLENERSAEGLKAVENEKKAFQSAIDSIRKSTNTISDNKEKAALLGLLSAFTSSAATQERLLKSPPNRRTDSTTANHQMVTAEMDELKKLLLDKEEQIAKLEQQVKLARQEQSLALSTLPKQPVVSSANSAAAAEWKEKYNRLKAASDRSSNQLESLKASYKQVVEDNRRLISQLQAARAGKQ